MSNSERKPPPPRAPFKRRVRNIAPICVYEEEGPKVIPVPFSLNLDGAENEDLKEDPMWAKPKRTDVAKLDALPYVQFASRALHFSVYQKAPHSIKKPRESNVSTMNIIGDEAEARLKKLECTRLPALDQLARNIKTKLNAYLNNKEVTFTKFGHFESFSRSVADTQKAKIRAHTGKRPDEDPERFPCRELAKAFKWVNSLELSVSAVSTIYNTWKSAGRKLEQPSDEEITETAQELGLTRKDVMSLDLIKDSIPNLSDFLEKSSRGIIPDVLKMLALTAWQNFNTSECLFYLSESQNFFIRREILAKNDLYFARKINDSSKAKTPEGLILDEKQAHLFKLQSHELRCFGKSQNEFDKGLQNVNPDWNVVQLTKLFHHKNRFGISLSESAQPSAIFISALINIMGSRQPFVTFQPPPSVEAGVTKHNVVERIKIVMVLNRKINEVKTDRQNYWRMRKKHNEELKTLLDAFQENWLFPWDFLLTGNICEKTIVKRIIRCLQELEQMSHVTFTPGIRTMFYKLIENYSMLKESLQTHLSLFLGSILNLSEENSKELAMKVSECGSKFSSESYTRSPTILVLDQELDLIPWESMPCLKSTPITRVPSISMINCLSTLRNIKKQKYGEILDPAKCAYLLNPDGSLQGVEDRLRDYFVGARNWVGVSGRKPPPEDMESFLQTKDIYLYCGHGSGSSYFSESRIQKVTLRAIPLLMGCGSLRYKHLGPRTFSTSMLNSLFTATCVGAVGFLYEVTDLECDRITLELLERWAPGDKRKLPPIQSFDPNAPRDAERCLASAVRLARSGATQFMTQAGLVYYGIPVITLDT